MKYEIIHLKNDLGLFAIVEKDGGLLHICKICDDGNLQTYSDGERLVITAIDEKDKRVAKTPLTFNWRKREKTWKT